VNHLGNILLPNGKTVRLLAFGRARATEQRDDEMMENQNFISFENWIRNREIVLNIQDGMRVAGREGRKSRASSILI